MTDMKFLDTLEEVLLERGFPLDIVQKALETAQTIDAVEVVRCKECKHAYRIDGPKEEYDCRKVSAFAKFFRPEHFCSYGERKNGDGNG